MTRNGWTVLARLTCAAVGVLYIAVGADPSGGFVFVAVGLAMLACAIWGPDGIAIYLSFAGFALLFLATVIAAILPILCENSDDCGEGLSENVLGLSAVVSVTGWFLTLLLILRDWPRRPPAAWYADPHEPDTRYRYWDGKRWTEHWSPR